MKRSLVLSILCATGMWSASASACNYWHSSVRNFTIDFDTITVQRDIPIGTVIAHQTTPESPAYVTYGETSCSTRRALLYSTAAAVLSPHIYPTNIEGVGIQVRYNSGDIIYQNPPLTGSGFGRFGVNAPTHIRLFKTGPITGGTLEPGIIARYDMGNGAFVGRTYYMGTGTINVMACSVQTPVVNVPMGEHPLTDFTGVGYTTAPVDVPISLDCDGGARINAEITAQAASGTSQPGAMQLDSGADSASGVAIQLLNSAGTPVALNQKFVVDTVESPGDYHFNWTARYLQTNATVTSGQANTTATLSLTYE